MPPFHPWPFPDIYCCPCIHQSAVLQDPFWLPCPYLHHLHLYCLLLVSMVQAAIQLISISFLNAGFNNTYIGLRTHCNRRYYFGSNVKYDYAVQYKSD